ncbi:hypothetical protein BTM25_51670 [Actinomadura rubteroloni]|uniref:Uncharacterized protein n=1 Tax=Actinomadura rubteroloni TaxID=1926885 RepID=A0A2P4UD45_9ACTN|nr:hypothetical protein BTM25_51670 [Actinomadura rubteroloni]
MSVFVALLTGMFLDEHESGMERLSNVYTWIIYVWSALIGLVAIAIFRGILHKNIGSWWLTCCLIPSIASALLLAGAG